MRCLDLMRICGPESEIGEGAHVGNFVETKKVRLGKGSKANHLTYLGDAEIGEGVNVGAGAITCNYDGVSKRKTVIGDDVFVGSDSVLVAPISLGNGSYIAAGSCITEDVPEDALALGRAQADDQRGWAAQRRNRSRHCNLEDQEGRRAVRRLRCGPVRRAIGIAGCGRKSRSAVLATPEIPSSRLIMAGE